MKINFSIDYKNRVLGLDILRFLSIFYVVYAHGYDLIKNKISVEVYHSIFIVDDAVTIFFVLSGFLIGRILIKTYYEEGLSKENLYNFWIRRWFRTLPNYYLIVFLLLAYNFLKFHHKGDFNWKYLFFLQNFKTTIPGFFPESWSLATEEWFYLLIPICLFIGSFFVKDKKRFLLLVILTFIVLPLAYRFRRGILLHNTHPMFYAQFSQEVITRMDSTMYGVLGAFLKYFYEEKWQKMKYWGVIIAIAMRQAVHFAPFIAYGFYAQVFSFSVEPLEILLCFPLMDSIKKGKGIFFKAITFMSIVSYAMYMLNLSIILGIIMPYLEKHSTLLHHSDYLNYGIYWGITLGLSYGLFVLYERPMMNLRNTFERKKLN